MGDADAFRDLGLGLEQSPASTELRLPARIGWANRIGLGSLGIVIGLFWAGLSIVTWNKSERGIPLIAFYSIIAMSLLFLLSRLLRVLRHGATVTITPERVTVKPHWTTGQVPIRLALDQVRIEQARRELVMMGGRTRIGIGSGLTPGDRELVKKFLDEVIDGYLHRVEGGVLDSPGAKEPATAASFVITAQAGGSDPRPDEGATPRDESLDPQGTDRDRTEAQRFRPEVVAISGVSHGLEDEVRSFERRTHLVSRPLVTPVIVAACVGVFVAMVTQGASVMDPSGPVMVAWGANFGPSLVFDHQTWRLFTSMFLHFGLFHLGMNMYCLATAGPVVERFFGHLGFAALYFVSGLGGSIASLWVHPTYICAGASGAIFGIFGGLLGYLAIRHREVPPAVLRPLRGGALAFVGYNTLFSLGIPKIDMAAHLGGLAAGFLCGLMMTAVTRTPAEGGSRLVRAFTRLAVAATLTAGLALLGLEGIDVARGRILADPNIGPIITMNRNVVDSWNSYNAAASPLYQEFDRIGLGIDQITTDLQKEDVPKETIQRDIDRLKRDSKAIGAKLESVPAGNAEIRTIRDHLVSAQSLQIRMLDSLAEFLATGDEAHIEGPRGFVTSSNAYLEEFKTMESLRVAYFKTHKIQIQPAAR